MNDRHAWAEAYIKNVGWLAFDIQPEQVESHAETPVDANLLEELIDMIDPGQELIPEDSGKDEIGLRNTEKENPVSLNLVFILLVSLITLIIIANIGALNFYKF